MCQLLNIAKLKIFSRKNTPRLIGYFPFFNTQILLADITNDKKH
jgi:hypothetical protein